jgi:7,8-dihydropterin-6-yl-methyl-4-(beta-D-ribofuranosyl)aminobenzene 5'-phosphate synthase
VFTGNKNTRPFLPESSGLVVMRGGEMLPEDFIHEQYLVIEEGDKKVLITGCSHKGILNIMHWMKDSPPDVVIGGFHLMHNDFSEESRNKLDDLAARLAEYETVYYTCHCTGINQYEYLKARMNKNLYYISAGQELEL